MVAALFCKLTSKAIVFHHCALNRQLAVTDMQRCVFTIPMVMCMKKMDPVQSTDLKTQCLILISDIDAEFNTKVLNKCPLKVGILEC